MNILVSYFLFQVLGLYAITLLVEYVIVPGSKYLTSRQSKFAPVQVAVRREENRFKKAS